MESPGILRPSQPHGLLARPMILVGPCISVSPGDIGIDLYAGKPKKGLLRSWLDYPISPGKEFIRKRITTKIG